MSKGGNQGPASGQWSLVVGTAASESLNTNGAIITIVLLSTIIHVITLIIFVLILHINMSKRKERLQIKLNNMLYGGM